MHYCSSARSIWLNISQFSLNGHLYKMNTLLKRIPRVGPCLSLVLLVDSLKDGRLTKTNI